MKRFWQRNSHIFKFILRVFIFWAVFIFLLDFILPYTGIPYRGGYNYTEKIVFNPFFLWNRANFDGIHYLDIAQKGYGIYQQAFFPFYPNLIRLFSPVFEGRNLVAGFVISNISCFFALFIFYRLILLDFKDRVAQRAVIYLILFPTSFFLGMVYTESLFLLLVLGSFYACRKKRWLLSGILGALAANTRLVGIFLFPALLYEWWQQRKVQGSKFKVQSFLSLLIIPFGLLLYIRFLALKYNDPLMFIHTQPFFGAGRSGGKIILIYQVFWRYFKMILTTKADPLYFTVWLELLTVIAFLYLLIKCYLKNIRISYLIFSFFSLIIPSLSGTFSSFPRYAIVLFPCFIYLGTIENRSAQRIIALLFLILAVISISFFFKGYWIS